MKNKIKKIYEIIKPYLPFIILFIFYLAIHFKLVYISDDRINGNKTFDEGQISYLIKSYKTSSSRLFIYLINNCFYLMPMKIWKIVDTLMIVIGAKCISKLFNDKKDYLLDWVICIIVSLFPFIQMSSAGFIATTLTYYWTIVFLLIAMLPVKKIFKNEEIKTYFYPLYFLLLIYATDCEQLCVFLFGLSLCFILYKKYNKKEKVHWYLIGMLLFSILKLIFIKTCPGNSVRAAASTIARFPLYDTLSFFDKFYMGIKYTTYVLISSGIPLFVLTLLLCVQTNIKDKNKFNIVLSNVLLVIVSFMTVFSNILINNYTYFSRYVNDYGIRITSNIYNINIPSLLLSVFMFTGIIYLILINFRKNYLPIVLFLGGLATQFIMIFSPTIYASGQRTGSIMFYSLLVISFIIFKDIYNKKRNLTILISIFVILSLMYYLNFIYLY